MKENKMALTCRQCMSVEVVTIDLTPEHPCRPLCGKCASLSKPNSLAIEDLIRRIVLVTRQAEQASMNASASCTQWDRNVASDKEELLEMVRVAVAEELSRRVLRGVGR